MVFLKDLIKLSLGIPDISHLVENGHAIPVQGLKAERVCFCMSQLKRESPVELLACALGTNNGRQFFMEMLFTPGYCTLSGTYWLIYASGIHICV